MDLYNTLMNKIKFTLIVFSALLLTGCKSADIPTETAEIPESVSHELIKVDSPRSREEVSSPVTISGEARGNWYFEADFPIQLYDAENNLLGTSIGTAQSEWMTEEFVQFKSELKFETPKTETGTLILRKDNPSGLTENDDQLEIPVKFGLPEAVIPVDYEVEEFASNLEVPWSIAFTSPERMLVTERPGRLRVIEKGVLKEEPLHVFHEVSSTGEEGLMSITIDPNYERNRWIYLSLAYEKEDEGMKVKVLRFVDKQNRLEEESVIIDDLPAARFHAGCRLAFGPDGKLYVTVGDALNRQDAQDLESLAGKILRIDKDGSIPPGNPLNGYIYSYGHRNPQGLAWHPETGDLYATEHGPSVFDGPAGGDEVNRIVAGGNYGWPLVSHDEKRDGTIPPLIQFTPAEPPGSLMIYSGENFPQFKHNLFYGSLKGEGLMRLILDPKDPNKISFNEKLPEVKFGRIRDVIEGPDGYIYFTTSNRDGRGNPAADDDRIFRIKPI